jgi:fibronectin-binding autotransporter adhesin
VTLLSLNLASGGINWTNTSGTLTAPGILKSGGGSSTISGGNVSGGGNTELVIRTDTASDSLAISSILSQGSGALTKSGAGTLTLSGNNTYTGQTHINAGTLSIGANVNLGAEATGATLNLKGGTLQATGTFGLFNGTAGTNNRAVTLLDQSTIEVTGANTLTIAGVISGTTSGFEKTGTGTLVLSGTNTYTGPTIITAGTLGLVISDSSTSKSLNDLTLNGGALELMFTVAPSATVPALTILGDLTFTGTPTIKVSATEGLFASGVSYPLLTVVGSAPSTVPTLVLEGISGQLEWGGTGGSTLFLAPLSGGTVFFFQ